MAKEQTTQSVENQTNNTESFVPFWKIEADKKYEAVKQGLGSQVVFMSNNNVDCEPVLVSEKMDTSSYPYVIEAPTGFIAPKYQWFGAHKGWIETANIQQGKDLAKAKEDINKLQHDAEELYKTAGKVENVSQEVQANKDELTQAINQVKEDSQDSNNDVQNKLGQIITMVSTLMASASQATMPSVPTESTQSTEAKEDKDV